MRLTGRAVGLIVVAVLALLAAFGFGLSALFPVVGLCLALVLGAVVLVALAGGRLVGKRELSAAVCQPGTSVSVQVSVELKSRLPLVLSSIRDSLEPGLAATAGDQLGEGSVERDLGFGYRIGSSVRGQHLLGPTIAVVGDPFGLVSKEIVGENRTPMTVLPQVVALPGGPLAEFSADDATATRYSILPGLDDVIARPHQYGDPLRRWHWKASARRGEPMVRQEEADTGPVLRLVLDTEARLYDNKSFEWNVSAAASKLSQAAELRHQAVLTCGTFGKFDTTDLAAALLALALVEPADDGLLGEPGADSVIVLTGRIDQVRARQLIERFGLTPTQVIVAPDSRGSAVDELRAARMTVEFGGGSIADTFEALAQTASR